MRACVCVCVCKAVTSNGVLKRCKVDRVFHIKSIKFVGGLWSRIGVGCSVVDVVVGVVAVVY